MSGQLSVSGPAQQGLGVEVKEIGGHLCSDRALSVEVTRVRIPSGLQRGNALSLRLRFAGLHLSLYIHSPLLGTRPFEVCRLRRNSAMVSQPLGSTGRLRRAQHRLATLSFNRDTRF